MPIDASIPLDVKQPQVPTLNDWATLANTRQNISASQTQQQATQAQIPGMQADAQLKQRQAAFKQWQVQNADRYMVPDPNSDDDNAPKVPDINKFVNLATQDGFTTEAQQVAATDLDNKSKAITNSTSANNYMMDALGHTANLLSGTTKPAVNADGSPVIDPVTKKQAMVPDTEQQLKLLRQYSQFTEQKVPGSGQYLMKAFTTPAPAASPQQVPANGGVATPNQDGSQSLPPVTITAPQPGINQEAIQAVKQATISPETQVSQGISTGQLKLAQMQASPEYQEKISQIPGAPARVAAATNAADIQAYQQQLKKGVDAASNLSTSLPTGIGSWTAQKWAQYVSQDSTGRALQVQNALDAMNKQNGTNITIANGWPAIQQALNSEFMRQGTRASRQSAIAASPTVGGAVTATPSPLNTVTQAHLQDYAKRSGKTVQQVIQLLKAQGINVQ